MNTSALCTSIIALTAMVAIPTAQAADTTLTLACKGTKTHQSGAGTSSEAINIGLIVDFQKKTIVGFRESDKLLDRNNNRFCRNRDPERHPTV